MCEMFLIKFDRNSKKVEVVRDDKTAKDKIIRDWYEKRGLLNEQSRN